jgi:methylated-DNA-protein-cysteine methyltransferase-like protein
MTRHILEAIRAVPYGKVATYGQIAVLADHPRGTGGARDVVRILSSMSKKENLSWWRIVRADRTIALPSGEGAELQRNLLEREGVFFDREGKIAAISFWNGIDLSNTPNLPN